MTAPFIAPTVGRGRNDVPFTLIQPFRDPVGTFRAQTISDTYRIVPKPTTFYDYSLGVPPGIIPIIYTIQNRTISHTLEVKLTLPSYLRAILANLGPLAAPPDNPFVFHVPARGDKATFPIPVSAPILASGEPSKDFIALATRAFAQQNIVVKNTEFAASLTGEGIVNVVITFDESQALLFNPGQYLEAIIFDITPVNVTGPVFVDVNAASPPNLNLTIGIDPSASLSAVSSTTGSQEGLVEVPVVVETQVFVPDLAPRWVDGTDGILKSGSAPAGWTAEADGRYYPPITSPAAGLGAERVTGLLGLILSGSQTASFTPLEALVNEVSGAAESFIGAKRRGFLIDTGEFLQGIQPARVTRESLNMLVADIGITLEGSSSQFQILNWPDRFVNSQSVPDPITDARTREFFQFINTGVNQVRSGHLPFTFETARQWTVSSNAKKIIDTNERYNVPTNLTEDDIQIIRSIATVAALVTDIKKNGEGAPVKP